MDEIKDFLSNRPAPRQANQRMGICQKCEHLQRLSICSQCGCVMPIKVRIPTMHCPIGKW